MEDTVSSVSIKIPGFMHAAVDGWFAICEAQFELRNISNETTQFYHVLSNLPPDLITTPPITIITSKSYTKLREAIINVHEQSKLELFNRLIDATTITGKPSTYLHELMVTASKIGVGEEHMWHKFIQALPSEITPIIATVKNTVVEGKTRILVWHTNLIRHLISPNQDDLSYSARTFHFRPTNRVSCQTHSLWLENATQCRCLTGGSSSSSMDTRGNPSNLWIPLKESHLNINLMHSTCLA